MATHLTPRASQAAVRTQSAVESKGFFQKIGEAVGQLFRINTPSVQKTSNTKDSFGPMTYQRKLQINTQALIQGKTRFNGKLSALDSMTLPFLDQMIRGQDVR